MAVWSSIEDLLSSYSWRGPSFRFTYKLCFTYDLFSDSLGADGNLYIYKAVSRLLYDSTATYLFCTELGCIPDLWLRFVSKEEVRARCDPRKLCSSISWYWNMAWLRTCFIWSLVFIAKCALRCGLFFRVKSSFSTSSDTWVMSADGKGFGLPSGLDDRLSNTWGSYSFCSPVLIDTLNSPVFIWSAAFCWLPLQEWDSFYLSNSGRTSKVPVVNTAAGLKISRLWAFTKSLLIS